MPTVVTDREAFRETVNDALEAARVPVEVRVTVADPFAAYRRARDGPGGVYLETTAGQSGWGYFAVDPVERLQVGSDLANEADVPTLAELRRLLDGERLVRGDCDVPYPCGAFGWLSSDVARELETLPEKTVDDRALPRLQVGVYDTVAAWEEPREMEATRRGPYTGSIGVFGFDGRATLNIVIRTLVRRGDEYGLRVGAGIVHDSVPEREYEETLDKGRALVNAVDDALGDRADLDVEDAEEGVTE